jgi:LysM repeat protein
LRTTAIEYTVQEGDSVFGIAQKFNIAPETVLWSNYDVLRDNPHKLAIGQVLKIRQPMEFGTNGPRGIRSIR